MVWLLTTTIPLPTSKRSKARLFLIEFDDDQINSPEFTVLDREMPRVKNGRYVIIQTGKQGNGEASNISNAELWLPRLHEFLRSLPH